MNDDLKDRIKRAYAKGVDELDESALDSVERDARLQKALEQISDECALAWSVQPFVKPCYRIALTQADHPRSEEWIFCMKNPEKLAWIEAHGQPYPIFWLKVSRVADYYDYFYNHWVPRGDSGYLDADCRREPTALWLGHEKIIRKALEGLGFIYLTDELAGEKVPFVLKRDYDSIPLDDPKYDDPDYEPPIVPTTIVDCLFAH
jgi:hypothetical protein